MAAQPYRIRLFGGFVVEKPTGELERSLSRPRAQAMFAVLAVSGPLGCTRDRLMHLLWSDKDQERARHSLRDTLYALRAVVGADALTGQGETLRLSGARVDSDVQRFTEALKAGRAEEAVDLYRGPLLHGFHLGDAPQFERWLDAERARLLRERQQAAKQLARRAEREERWDAAADWWGRAVELDPCNSRLVVRRMVALTHAGDRANAIAEGEAHRDLLRTELDLEPDAAFVETLVWVRGGGGPVQFFTPWPPRPHPDDPRRSAQPPEDAGGSAR